MEIEQTINNSMDFHCIYAHHQAVMSWVAMVEK